MTPVPKSPMASRVRHEEATAALFFPSRDTACRRSAAGGPCPAKELGAIAPCDAVLSSVGFSLRRKLLVFSCVRNKEPTAAFG
jgi:hypothetical protein